MKSIILQQIYHSKRGKYPYLTDLFYSKKPDKVIVKETPYGTVVDIDDVKIHQYLEVTRQMDIDAVGTTDTPTYWELIKEVLELVIPTNGIHFIKEVPCWFEIENLLLEVPVGVRSFSKEDNSQKTWGEWSSLLNETLNGVFPKRYIVRPEGHASQTLDMNSLNILIDYSNNTNGITILNEVQLKDLRNSNDYKL